MIAKLNATAEIEKRTLARTKTVLEEWPEQRPAEQIRHLHHVDVFSSPSQVDLQCRGSRSKAERDDRINRSPHNVAIIAGGDTKEEIS